MNRKIQVLKDLKVLSIALNLPGPFLCYRLAQFGAKVTKVEPPQGDLLATHFPEYYRKLHAKQKIIALDLKNPKNVEKLFTLLSKTDLFITSSRPESLDKLGIGWKTLHRKFPKLSLLSILSYPGERSGIPGHDLNFQAESGLLRPPSMPVTPYADIAGAQEALIQVLAGIPKGKKIEVALSEALAPFQDPVRYKLTGDPDRMLGGALPHYNLYPARDGWIALAALEPHFAEKLLKETGLSKLSRAGLSEFFSSRSAQEWEGWGAERGIPISRVADMP